MTFETRRTISADHPSLPGHFPGAPIVPAVLILDEIVTAIAEWLPECQLAGITATKFLAPLKPGQPFTIRLETLDDVREQIDVSCRVADRLIVQGRLLVRRRSI
jgi:3-hydroxyacyl-[acyl-carrier-protein] dehydratase